MSILVEAKKSPSQKSYPSSSQKVTASSSSFQSIESFKSDENLKSQMSKKLTVKNSTKNVSTSSSKNTPTMNNSLKMMSRGTLEFANQSDPNELITTSNQSGTRVKMAVKTYKSEIEKQLKEVFSDEISNQKLMQQTTIKQEIKKESVKSNAFKRKEEIEKEKRDSSSSSCSKHKNALKSETQQLSELVDSCVENQFVSESGEKINLSAKWLEEEGERMKVEWARAEKEGKRISLKEKQEYWMVKLSQDLHNPMIQEVLLGNILDPKNIDDGIDGEVVPKFEEVDLVGKNYSNKSSIHEKAKKNSMSSDSAPIIVQKTRNNNVSSSSKTDALTALEKLKINSAKSLPSVVSLVKESRESEKLSNVENKAMNENPNEMRKTRSLNNTTQQNKLAEKTLQGGGNLLFKDVNSHMMLNRGKTVIQVDAANYRPVETNHPGHMRVLFDRVTKTAKDFIEGKTDDNTSKKDSNSKNATENLDPLALESQRKAEEMRQRALDELKQMGLENKTSEQHSSGTIQVTEPTAISREHGAPNGASSSSSSSSNHFTIPVDRIAALQTSLSQAVSSASKVVSEKTEYVSGKITENVNSIKENVSTLEVPDTAKLKDDAKASATSIREKAAIFAASASEAIAATGSNIAEKTSSLISNDRVPTNIVNGAKDPHVIGIGTKNTSEDLDKENVITDLKNIKVFPKHGTEDTTTSIKEILVDSPRKIFEAGKLVGNTVADKLARLGSAFRNTDTADVDQNLQKADNCKKNLAEDIDYIEKSKDSDDENKFGPPSLNSSKANSIESAPEAASAAPPSQLPVDSQVVSGIFSKNIEKLNQSPALNKIKSNAIYAAEYAKQTSDKNVKIVGNFVSEKAEILSENIQPAKEAAGEKIGIVGEFVSEKATEVDNYTKPTRDVVKSKIGHFLRNAAECIDGNRKSNTRGDEKDNGGGKDRNSILKSENKNITIDNQHKKLNSSTPKKSSSVIISRLSSGEESDQGAWPLAKKLSSTRNLEKLLG